MKKVMRLVATVMALTLMAVSFSACSGSKPVIGIIQFGSHDSLNNCYTGIMEGLKESVDLDKYDVQYVNSNFTAETSLSQPTTH